MGDGGLASVVSTKTSGGPGIDVRARVVQLLHSGLWQSSIPRRLLSNTALPTLQRKMTVKNLGWEHLHLERMERSGDHLGHVPGKWR